MRLFQFQWFRGFVPERRVTFVSAKLTKTMDAPSGLLEEEGREPFAERPNSLGSEGAELAGPPDPSQALVLSEAEWIRMTMSGYCGKEVGSPIANVEDDLRGQPNSLGSGPSQGLVLSEVEWIRMTMPGRILEGRWISDIECRG